MGTAKITIKGDDKPYIKLEKSNASSNATEKFEFDTYHQSDGSGKKIAEKIIYIDPYAYKYEVIDESKKIYKIKMELSNVVINSVEVMNDELAHPELSSHIRTFDGSSGSIGKDHSENLKLIGSTYMFDTGANYVNTKDKIGTNITIYNYPGDGNLIVEDAGENNSTATIKKEVKTIGRQSFIGGGINESNKLAPGMVRKFFPLWREHEKHYISTGSTTDSVNLMLCEFSYPINSILLFGQGDIIPSANDSRSFFMYQWQDPAGAKNRGGNLYDQQEALGVVATSACEKLVRDYGEDNVRIYVVKYRAQDSYIGIPGNNVVKHDYYWVEKCASKSGVFGLKNNIYEAGNEEELIEALDKIADDIKDFSNYEGVRCVDLGNVN